MYEDHYGLTGRPFGLTPDSRFWFDTATHKKAMAYLGYGLSQGEGFIVISGDIGAGKTTLVGHLTDTVDADRLNVVKIVSTQIAADDLLRTVAAGLGVDATGLSKAAMLTAIERGLHAVARGGRRTLLIVDEAQALPVDSLEELRMLSNFQAGGHAMLQIFLLGQPEFRAHLAGEGLEQLRQRVIAMHHLGPMEADELEPYIVHRLGVVGWTGRPRFKTDALATIYAWSGGIPRRINALVSRVLLHGAIEGIETFTAADVDAVAQDLASDGMTGVGEVAAVAGPVVDAEAEVAANPVVDAEAEAEVEPITVDEDPVEVAAPTPAIAPIEPEPLPIAADAPVEHTAPEPRPIAAEVEDDVAPVEAEPAPAPEPRPVASRPGWISVPPRLFDPIKLRGRRPTLAAVDPAPVEPEAAVVGDAPVVEWPIHETAEVAPVAEPVSTPAPVADLDIVRRLAAIDKRMEEQDEALRRVLTLLVDWVEGQDARDAAELRSKLG